MAEPAAGEVQRRAWQLRGRSLCRWIRTVSWLYFPSLSRETFSETFIVNTVLSFIRICILWPHGFIQSLFVLSAPVLVALALLECGMEYEDAVHFIRQ